MASATLLLSSPARVPSESLVAISSSPDLPPIRDLVSKVPKRPALRSGSRAAPIPEDALMTFTSAANLWHSFEDDEDRLPANREKQEINPAGTKRPPSDAIVIDLLSDTRPHEGGSLCDAAATADRGARVSDQPGTTERLEESDSRGRAPTAKGNPRKRGTQVKGAKIDQTKMPKGRVTKPSARARRGDITGDPHPKTPQTSGPPVACLETDGAMEQEPALKRRTDWTPTKDTTPTHSLICSSPARETSTLTVDGPGRLDESGRHAVFRSLLDAYGCKHPEPPIGPPDGVGTADVLGKRKQNDMIATSEAPSLKNSAPKPKAPKKKPRTITELATAAYRQPQSEEGDMSVERTRPDSLLRYLDHDDGLREGETGKPPEGKRKAARKSTRSKTAKAEPRRPALLSPTSAQRQVHKQDFIFGTSSQLASEEDPESLRDLQEAIKLSNQGAQPEAYPGDPGREKSEGLSGNRLWSAAARGADGDLLDPEVIDLVDIPAVPEDLTNPAVVRTLAGDSRKTSRAAGSAGPGAVGSEIEVEALELPSSPRAPPSPPRVAPSKSSCTQRQQQRQQQQEQGARGMARPPLTPARPSVYTVVTPVTGMSSPDDEPPASNQEQNQQQLRSSQVVGQVVRPCGEQAGMPRPRYELFTDAQLAKEIRGYGFKAIKKRVAMIALLDQCWASRNKPARGSGMQAAASSTSSATQSAAAPVASAASAPATRPRGRPRKNTSGTTSSAAAPGAGPQRAVTQCLVEILDSESEDASSCRSASPEPGSACPLPPGASPWAADGTDLSLAASPTSEQASLFEFITRAVTTAPPSRDPGSPSWHEKMLMYDPIVLEDLTAWLNAGQLDRVKYDGEVAPGQVKKWCESKSVCCLWRYNLHGKERKRF